MALAKAAAVLSVATVLGLPYLAWVEGRVAAAVSRRRGPTRVGVIGLAQPFADVLKLMSKSSNGGSILGLGPMTAFLPPLIILGSIPVGILGSIPVGDSVRVALTGEVMALQVADLQTALVFIAGVTGFAVHGQLLASWALASDRALRHGVASVARSLGCMTALGLTLVSVAFVFSTLRLSDIVAAQAATATTWEGLLTWGVCSQPFGFAIYAIAVTIAVERRTQDAGGLVLVLLSSAHRLQLIALAALGVTIYLGAHHLPGLTRAGAGPLWLDVAECAVFATKVALLLFAVSWLRAALTRLGVGGVVEVGWKLLVPIAALNLLGTVLWVAVNGP